MLDKCPQCKQKRIVKKKIDGRCRWCEAQDTRSRAWFTRFASETWSRPDGPFALAIAVRKEIIGDGIYGSGIGLDTISAMARFYKINKGVIHRVLNGGDSPSLRQKLQIPIEKVSLTQTEYRQLVDNQRPAPRPKGARPKKKKQHRRAGTFTEKAVSDFDAMCNALDTNATQILNERLRQWMGQ